MADQPWLQDACSLVEAFRAGSISPGEALDASLAAIEASGLNAFSHLDVDAARAAAAAADVSLPFGGVPMGVKELETVGGWPFTEASLVFKDRTAQHDSTQVARLRAAGAVLAGQTTASEFGGDQLHLDQAPRDHPQSMGSRTHPGRVLGWIGGCGGRRPDPDRQRQ